MPLRSIHKNQLSNYQVVNKIKQRKNNGFSPNCLITNTKNHCFRHCWPPELLLFLLSSQPCLTRENPDAGGVFAG